MEEYKMSKEVKDFIKNNIDLIYDDDWEEVLYKASKTKGLFMAELIYSFVHVDNPEKENKSGNKITVLLSDALSKIIGNYEDLDKAIKKLK